MQVKVCQLCLLRFSDSVASFGQMQCVHWSKSRKHDCVGVVLWRWCGDGLPFMHEYATYNCHLRHCPKSPRRQSRRSWLRFPSFLLRSFAPMRSATTIVSCLRAKLSKLALNVEMSAELTLRLFLADMKYRQLDFLEHFAEHNSRDYHRCILDDVVTTTALLTHGHRPSFANRHQPTVSDCDTSLSSLSSFYTVQHQCLLPKGTHIRCENLVTSPYYTSYNGCPSPSARGKSQ